jgi:hypothetical protein
MYPILTMYNVALGRGGDQNLGYNNYIKFDLKNRGVSNNFSFLEF